MSPDPTRHVEEIARLARDHGFRVGAAESLTGGAVSSALARGSGAAEWYHGSLVSYHASVKHAVLGVTPGPLVSQRCAEEMVRGATSLLGVDAAVSATGAGGPGPEEGKPPGTVHLGVLVRGELTHHHLELELEPGELVEAVTERSLGLLLDGMRAHR